MRSLRPPPPPSHHPRWILSRKIASNYVSSRECSGNFGTLTSSRCLSYDSSETLLIIADDSGTCLTCSGESRSSQRSRLQRGFVFIHRLVADVIVVLVVVSSTRRFYYRYYRNRYCCSCSQVYHRYHHCWCRCCHCKLH